MEQGRALRKPRGCDKSDKLSAERRLNWAKAPVIASSGQKRVATISP
jgi:hypothetical protein